MSAHNAIDLGAGGTVGGRERSGGETFLYPFGDGVSDLWSEFESTWCVRAHARVAGLAATADVRPFRKIFTNDF